jgi:rod shape-determining protein MreB and related proteins
MRHRMPGSLSLSLRPRDVLPHAGPSDLAIDLGTANTRVYIPGEGVVLDEPSVIAIDVRDKKVLAVGRPAKAMIGRVPESIQVVSPVRRGVIADIGAAREMLGDFITSVLGRWRVRRPRVAIVVPYGTTQVEKRAVWDLGESVVARKVHLIEEPVAAALGAGLPVSTPGAHTIVNVGGGTTEVAVLSLSGIVCCESMRIGGEDLDEAMIQHVRKGHSLLIGTLQAEELKLAAGSTASPESGADRTSLIHDVKGRNLLTGLPATIGVSVQELREALHEPLRGFVDAVRACLERTPPELAADIVDTGIVLTGGGALLRGFDTALRFATRLPVRVSREPAHCAVLGAGRALADPALLTAMSVPR